MKNFISYAGVLLLLLVVSAAHAHNSTISISSPSDNQTIVVESLPVNIIAEGTISHSSPGNVNDQRACVKVDGGTGLCDNYVSGLGNVGSRNYSITVPINSAGQHTIQAFTAKSEGSHPGISAIITINVVLSITACDEKDPPAIANEYLNSINFPSAYASYRGQIIRVIAFNHSNGAYGACNYNEDAVLDDVDALLAQLGL